MTLALASILGSQMLFHLRAENKRATAGIIYQSQEGDGRTPVGGGSTAVDSMSFAPVRIETDTSQTDSHIGSD